METNLGTYRGQAITPELIGELSAKFESDWEESEITVAPTRYGKALQALVLPVDEIEALERRNTNVARKNLKNIKSPLDNL
jgi:hypothetical protein